MGQKSKNPQGLTSYAQSYQRSFSKELKRKKVKEIELGLISVSELSRTLEVSKTSIYRWKKRYSLNYKKPIQIIVESKSETNKIIRLQEELKLAKQILGDKEIENELLHKMIDIIGSDYGIDIDKKYFKKKPYCHGLNKDRS